MYVIICFYDILHDSFSKKRLCLGAELTHVFFVLSFQTYLDISIPAKFELLVECSCISHNSAYFPPFTSSSSCVPFQIQTIIII